LLCNYGCNMMESFEFKRDLPKLSCGEKLTLISIVRSSNCYIDEDTVLLVKVIDFDNLIKYVYCTSKRFKEFENAQSMWNKFCALGRYINVQNHIPEFHFADVDSSWISDKSTLDKTNEGSVEMIARTKRSVETISGTNERTIETIAKTSERPSETVASNTEGSVEISSRTKERIIVTPASLEVGYSDTSKFSNSIGDKSEFGNEFGLHNSFVKNDSAVKEVGIENKKRKRERNDRKEKRKRQLIEKRNTFWVKINVNPDDIAIKKVKSDFSKHVYSDFEELKIRLFVAVNTPDKEKGLRLMSKIDRFRVEDYV